MHRIFDLRLKGYRLNTRIINFMEDELDRSECYGILKPVRDALYILNGKWKLPIIISLKFGNKRFTEIAKDVHGITDRMLSKELQEMELNGLVERRVENSYPVKITYALTPHSKTLDDVIESLRAWGLLHRKKIMMDARKPEVVPAHHN